VHRLAVGHPGCPGTADNLRKLLFHGGSWKAALYPSDGEDIGILLAA
jgi:hypothetical protein